MQYALQVFQYEDRRDFRTIEIEGQLWFHLGDVCRAMELQPKKGSFTHHVERLDADERRLIPRSWFDLGSTPPFAARTLVSHGNSIVVISESGLYSLILTSNKPQAKTFKKWVTAEVLPAIRKTGTYGQGLGIPSFVRRYNENWDRVSVGYFSVISELFIRLWGRLEQVGYVMPDRGFNGQEMRPDVSVGRRFSEWLGEHHSDLADEYTFYTHKTPEWEGDVRQYPHRMLPLFLEFIDTVWIPEHAQKYFSSRDPAALPYLPKLLTPPKRPRTRLIQPVVAIRSGSL